jgi:hypothetical protein
VSPGLAPATVPSPVDIQQPLPVPHDPPLPHAPPPHVDLLGPVPDVNFGSKNHPTASSLRLAARGLGICIIGDDITNKSNLS